jgi:hypothetical protein
MLSPRPRQYTTPMSEAMHKCCELQLEDKKDIEAEMIGNVPVTLKVNMVSVKMLAGRTEISLLEPVKADDKNTL